MVQQKYGLHKPEVARKLVADIRKKWPTASILDWDVYPDHNSIPTVNRLLDAAGEDLVDYGEVQAALQRIVDKYSRELGWHEADPESTHFFSITEARDVTDGEDSVFEPGFRHAGWDFLERD
ncbi:MAG TPA: hypothetical protein VF885_11610 [Arthrobacter sp.]